MTLVVLVCLDSTNAVTNACMTKVVVETRGVHDNLADLGAKRRFVMQFFATEICRKESNAQTLVLKVLTTSQHWRSGTIAILANEVDRALEDAGGKGAHRLGVDKSGTESKKQDGKNSLHR